MEIPQVIWQSPDRKTHNHTDHVVMGERRVLKVQICTRSNIDSITIWSQRKDAPESELMQGSRRRRLAANTFDSRTVF